MGQERQVKVRRRVIIIAALLVGAVIYVTAVLPAGQLLGAVTTKHNDAATLRALQSENTNLKRRIAQLNSPQWIETIARNDFGMYPTGSTPYQILPSSPLYHPRTHQS
ncbi:FtsB family cell division protein [Ferrimicrobium acidiphilum]|uniref:FtsB family cell division protein n=1 Tax=Ferrimicrobium acidiphilum TaxID=121039 RepID=UPI0009DCD8D6|nr:septum formation initiator family protein [Ferrimicrobium acidiphilum]MCL5054010.1 septum formation initiator family protein [Gammaproteobacteria bacterium]